MDYNMNKRTFKKFMSFLIGFAWLSTCFSVSSCSEFNIGEYELTGDISELIPKSAYNLEKQNSVSSDGATYLFYAPKMSSNFELWNLSIKSVDYYIDNKLTKTSTEEPYDFYINLSELPEGDHTLLAKICVCGKKCDDTYLEVTDNFMAFPSSVQLYKDIFIDYNFINEGEKFVITPILNELRSSPGCQIDKVEYYWDNKLTATKTQAPYTWDSQIVTDKEPHDWRVYVRYSFNGKNESSYNYGFSNYRTLKEDNHFTVWNVMSGRNDFSLGESIPSIIKSYRGKNFKDKVSAKLYFDDTLIAETSSFPFKNEFKLTNQSIGIHKMKCAITVTSGNQKTTSYDEKSIVVTP